MHLKEIQGYSLYRTVIEKFFLHCISYGQNHPFTIIYILYGNRNALSEEEDPDFHKSYTFCNSPIQMQHSHLLGHWECIWNLQFNYAVQTWTNISTLLPHIINYSVYQSLIAMMH